MGCRNGLTVDCEGGVWVALFGGSAVRRYGPAGTLEEVLELPVTQVTACAFGGDGLEELYITTSRENLPDEEQPQAGSVFRARPCVPEPVNCRPFITGNPPVWWGDERGRRADGGGHVRCSSLARWGVGELSLYARRLQSSTMHQRFATFEAPGHAVTGDRTTRSRRLAGSNVHSPCAAGGRGTASHI
jgi:hypothetical protein